jgi:hypothetical protein
MFKKTGKIETFLEWEDTNKYIKLGVFEGAAHFLLPHPSQTRYASIDGRDLPKQGYDWSWHIYSSLQMSLNTHCSKHGSSGEQDCTMLLVF